MNPLLIGIACRMKRIIRFSVWVFVLAICCISFESQANGICDKPTVVITTPLKTAYTFNNSKAENSDEVSFGKMEATMTFSNCVNTTFTTEKPNFFYAVSIFTPEILDLTSSKLMVLRSTQPFTVVSTPARCYAERVGCTDKNGANLYDTNLLHNRSNSGVISKLTIGMSSSKGCTILMNNATSAWAVPSNFITVDFRFQSPNNSSRCDSFSIHMALEFTQNGPSWPKNVTQIPLDSGALPDVGAPYESSSTFIWLRLAGGIQTRTGGPLDLWGYPFFKTKTSLISAPAPECTVVTRSAIRRSSR